MTFSEQLALAKQNNINIAELNIAYEVECSYEEGVNTPRFEDICKAVYNLWLKTEGLEVCQLISALKDAIKTQGCTLDGVLDYEDDWNMVIDLACQCTH